MTSVSPENLENPENTASAEYPLAAAAPQLAVAKNVSILMYHSISDTDGPTAIAPETFKMQMEALDAEGATIIPLADIRRWHAGELTLPKNAVAITFDDAFADFATHAFPELFKRRWPATLFVPTRKLGQAEDWAPHPTPRKLLDWPILRELANAGIDLGGHSATHADLTKLSPADLVDEIYMCKEDIFDNTGLDATSFAQPFGYSNKRVREVIAQHFDLAVGTAFAKAKPKHNLFELPRIEMHYFRDPKIWQNFLRGTTGYYKTRQSLRSLRRLVTRH